MSPQPLDLGTTSVEIALVHMATIAIGDIHGNRPALDDLLDQIRGDVAEGDTIVFLGDYIDRGPESKGCVDTILRFQRDVGAEVVCLLGNHEDWLLQTQRDHTRHLWLLLGTETFDTIRSYSVDAARILGDVVSNAGAELIRGRCEVPDDVFFDMGPPKLCPAYRTAPHTRGRRLDLRRARGRGSRGRSAAL